MSADVDQHCLFPERGGMMDGIRAYILSVTAAGIICGIVNALLGEKGTYSGSGKMLAGIFMAVVVVRPLAHIQISNLDDFLGSLTQDADAVTASGKNLAQEEIADIIKEEVEAYILDKAASQHVELSVEVMVELGDVPELSSVRLSGNVSPYAKQQLTQLIEEDLGIAKENQIWTG